MMSCGSAGMCLGRRCVARPAIPTSYWLGATAEYEARYYEHSASP
jgi:hypothetical protein